MTIVKNLNNTSDKSCSCGSWLEHYYRYSRADLVSLYKTIFLPTTKCSVKECGKTHDLVGAHVKKVRVSPSDDAHYIIPMCKEHNHSSNNNEMEVEPDTVFVSANIKETCGK